MNSFKKLAAAAALMAITQIAQAQTTDLHTQIDQLANKLEPKVIQWRRDFHQNPELSNREVKTAEIVAKHLKGLGFEVKTGVAKTGVIGILKGGQPGPVVALRADMDALPVTERNSLPFASKVRTTFNNQEVGVMHACGHDTHVAMLMGAAEILAQHKKDLKGTVKFIFQPAEEGAPAGEEGGADVMVAQGALENPKVDAIFGLHINSATEVGTLKYRPQGTMASSDNFKIKVKGRQAHGAYPWSSVDPIVVSAQIINGIQTIVSRQMELTNEAAVITVGAIHGGVRTNIIPEEVEMIGTIRALDPKMQDQLHEKLRRTAEMIAASAGATATVEIVKNTPITYNHEALTAHILPTLQTVAGQQNVVLTKAVTGAEDFAYYQQKVPGVFIFVGGMSKGQDVSKIPAHHTPDFMIDESGLKLGVRTLAYLAIDYLNNPLKK